MANENMTVEQVLSRAESGDWNCSRCGDQCDCPNTENIIKALASDIRVAHNREIIVERNLSNVYILGLQDKIAELETQVRIAKDAFFKIAQRKHSREIHDIVCEAEFTMNHPECRNEVSNG